MFQRQISQIFLIHANRLNAETLDAILSKLEDRGYEFISLVEALRDPAYSTLDVYSGSFGISWFHRWSLSLGYGTRETQDGRTFPETLWREPDAPEFVMKLAEQSP